MLKMEASGSSAHAQTSRTVIIDARTSNFKDEQMPASFQDLVALMTRLRSPEGCPWDREQTYATLAPMLLEEAYEAFEAVEEAREGRPEHLREELGDLLFQIVFYAQVAAERGEFNIEDRSEERRVGKECKNE